MQVDLNRLTKGDKQAWDHFVAFASPVIYSAIRRSGGASLGAEAEADLAQDVFVRLCREQFRLLKTYDPERAALTTWLSLVARSITLDALRRRRIPTTSMDDLDHEPQAAPSPCEEQSLPLPAGVLSDRQALVLKLLYERDMEVAEAAALLGIEPQTLRSTKHKALTRLRQYRAEKKK